MGHEDPTGAEPVTRDTDRGGAGDDGREATPTPIAEIDPDDLPVAPGLERAGGDRASQDLRRERAGLRWASRPRSRAEVNRAGGLDVLAAIDTGALRGGR